MKKLKELYPDHWEKDMPNANEEFRGPEQILKELENLDEYSEWLRTKISNPDDDDEAFGGHVSLAIQEMKKALKHFPKTYVNECLPLEDENILGEFIDKEKMEDVTEKNN